MFTEAASGLPSVVADQVGGSHPIGERWISARSAPSRMAVIVRSDKYAHMFKPRSLEATGVVSNVWGADRVAVRLSPNVFNGMSDSQPLAPFSHVGEGLNQFQLA
jgi:hypothetical protein